jgi:hypothetical protein
MAAHSAAAVIEKVVWIKRRSGLSGFIFCDGYGLGWLKFLSFYFQTGQH